MTAKKAIGKIHLILGLASGIIVMFLGITGCILAFEREIRSLISDYQNVKVENTAFLQPSKLKQIAVDALPGKSIHSVQYGERDKAAMVTFYNADPDYYYLVYINPYDGQVLKVKNMNRDFFRIVVMGHYYLWLPPAVGQPITATATLIFLVMMITGIVLWWPKNKAARKQRFTIRWGASWKRRNYDLHNVLGFYMTWVAIFIAITGLVMGFQWFAKSVYWVTSGGKSQVAYYEPVSEPRTAAAVTDPVDKVWKMMQEFYPSAQSIEVHFPETDSAAIGAGANPDAETYWKLDFRYFDQYTLKEINVTHAYGRFAKAGFADKLSRMNYDIHVGAIGGIPTKILAFSGSLLAASLPLTGFLIWRGRRRKKKSMQPALKTGASKNAELSGTSISTVPAN